VDVEAARAIDGSLDGPAGGNADLSEVMAKVAEADIVWVDVVYELANSEISRPDESWDIFNENTTSDGS
jgi:hypothetical protein